MARILSGADFGVRFPSAGGVANNNFGNSLSAQLLGKALEFDQQDKLREQEIQFKKNQAEQLTAAQAEKDRFGLMMVDLQSIQNMEHGPAKKAALAKYGQNEITEGRDGREFIEALNANTPDEFNLAIGGLINKAGVFAGQIDEVLKANAPATPLSPEGKLQTDINEGILTEEQAKSRENEGLASAKSEFLEGGGTRKILPNGVEEVTNRFGKVVTGQDAVDVINRSAKIVADKERATQDLRVETERDIIQVRNAEKTSAKAFDMVDKLRQNITNLEQVTPLIGQGANTGPISQIFPSIKAATIRLENLQKRLSLDVVGATTFGALSKGELDLAKAVAIPLGLEGDDLIEWTNDAIAAKRKLANYFEDQAIFLSNGGTQTEWLQKQKAELQSIMGDATEADIRQTMRDNNMTRPQVLNELRRRRDGS